MNTRRIVVMGCAAGILAISASVAAGWWTFSSDDDEAQDKDLITIEWPDLIPDDFVQPENPFATMTQEEVDVLLNGSEESEARLKKLEEEFYYAPVVDDLDGKRVKIGAYITPLEFDGQSKFNEFLLVPYMGACMHTPPPPANQIVHATPPEAVEVNNPYDPVWAIGTIRTETVKSNLAESGYRLELEKLLPYTQ